MPVDGDFFTITEDGATIIGVLLLLLGGVSAWIFRLILGRIAQMEQSLEIVRQQLSEHRLHVARNYVATESLIDRIQRRTGSRRTPSDLQRDGK